MKDFHLAAYVPLLRACAWLGSGILIGASHLLMLRWNVWMLSVGRARVTALVLQMARLALLTGLLAVIASHFGALPLILAATGILAARLVIAVRLGAPT